MSVAEALQTTINTLETISIRGEKDSRSMFTCIGLLKSVIVAIQEAKDDQPQSGNK